MKKYTHLNTLWKQIILIKKNKLSKLYWMFFVSALSLGLVPVLSSFFMKVIIDAVGANVTESKLILWITVLIGSTMGLYFIGNLVAHKLEANFLLMRQKEFNKEIELFRTIEYRYIEDKEFQDRFHNSIHALDGDGMGFQHAYTSLSIILRNIVSIMLFLILLSLFNIYVALICLLSTILTTLINKIVAKYQMVRKKDESHYYRQSRYFNSVCSDFEYGKDIRVFNLKESLMNKYQEKSLSYIKVIQDIKRKEVKVGLIELFVLLIQDSLSYYFIINGYFNGVLSIGDVSLYLTVIISLSTVLRTFIDEISLLNRDLKMSSLYFEIIDFSNGLNEKGGKLLKLDKEEEIEIEFKDVWFKYPNCERYILKGLNLKIEKGEKIAIVGINGSGKSTIVKLLCGLFEPEKGVILINGLNAKEFIKNEYYQMFSTVFQDFKIYACSIIENICGDEKEPENIERAMWCLEAMGLKEKIESLPNKYDSVLLKVIEEDGVELSGGEKQKIAIARALYKDANVVILDEPTSALDAISEANIYHGFDRLATGKTAIYISHRLSSTRFCDHIAFFDEEGLKEYGTHDELMKLRGKYYHMFNIQGQYYKEGTLNDE